MDRIKKIIIALSIIIIIIIVALLIILRADSTDNENENENEQISYEETYDEEGSTMDNSEFSIVTSNSEYYAISKTIDDLYEYSRIAYVDDYLDEEISDEDKAIYEDIILDIFGEKYKEEFSITQENLEEHVSDILENDYVIESMYYSTRDNNVCIYLVYGFLENENIDYDFMVVVDLKNNAFEVYLNDYVSKYEYIEDNIYNLLIENDNIELNEYNQYKSVDYSNEDMARNYLNNYKEMLQINLEKAYELLDSEYSEKKFDNYEEFEEYYEYRKKYISSCYLQKYKVESFDTYTQYTCMDNYGNYYIFNVEGVMKYTIQLDDYTIYTDEFIESYNSATDEEKVQTDIETFFKMINTCDYRSAYNLLNDTFRENNFSTLDDFVVYAKNNFFENTTITGVDSISQSGTYYVCTFNTASSSDEDSTDVETDSETFIVSLGSGTDFELSFTVE